MKKTILAASLLAASLSATATENTEITIAGWGGNDVVVLNNLVKEVLADDFEKAGLSVKYQAVEGDFSQFITNSLSAGTAPDAFYVDVVFANTLVNSGKVEVNSDSLANVSSAVIPSLNSAFTLNGKQYGIAKDFNTIALQYNKDIFDDAGVEYPTNSDSWEDLRKKLIAVKDELGDEVSGICVMPDYARFAPFALATGWKPFNEEGKTVLDENFERAFNFYTGLVSEDEVGILATDLGQGWGGGCFGTEETAVALEGNWISGYLRDKAPNLPYGTTLMPTDPKTGERGNLLFTVAWGINADSKNVEATQKAVEILTSQEAQEWVLDSGLALPSRESLGDAKFFEVEDSESELAKQVFKGALEGNVEPFAFGDYGTAWMTPINEALNSVLLGQMTQKEALKMAQAKYDVLTAK
ncbi:Extracellular solute-binding protein family 1 [Vibrio coralliirubri]|uniref:extracellular solute-binding protein n=1 Tax=Vibrio coralliirubri TaxID=1516159 RepID=UPI00062FAE34|nr:extracellular solute-binding protein [Vibrio coralliirubri]MCY9862452.1 extracellular solute-binding protein [Vibrio coralliirubri]CDT48546.1 Extracellular solute-binding protein family 1 [Vibrio coralliirubri]CDT87697.1 Extracellular solute-binding protein family 1 [Vibrio coralliirubri]CDU09944.1 Extracellular solute-binding protein family 1 [Vibrio coralliirubri]